MAPCDQSFSSVKSSAGREYHDEDDQNDDATETFRLYCEASCWINHTLLLLCCNKLHHSGASF